MRLLGPPTQGSVYQKLLQDQRVAEHSENPVINNAQVINTALDIECQQYVDFYIW
jgi:hypothetical protein